MQPTSNPSKGGHQQSDGEPRLRSRTFTSMGTVVSLAVRAAPHMASQSVEDGLEAAAAVVEQLFKGLERTFSLYRPDSESSAMARGELALSDASTDMRRLYFEASEW